MLDIKIYCITTAVSYYSIVQKNLDDDIKKVMSKELFGEDDVYLYYNDLNTLMYLNEALIVC